MRLLYPEPRADVDPYLAYRPPNPHDQLLRLNMVASVDGRATDADGGSGSLGGDEDFRILVTLRALADGIMVGAGTVRKEGYGPHRVRPALAERRADDGRPDPAPIVVVSRSLDLDPASRLFAEAVTPTIVLTCEAAPDDRRRRLEAVARVVDAGAEQLDLAAGVQRLRNEHGLAHLLCEGGPSLNGHLLGHGLVDEVCLTLAPQLAGGSGPTIVEGLQESTPLDLVSLLTDDADVFARYRATRSNDSGR